MRKLSFLLVLLLLTAMQVLAQRTITGKVTSADDGNGIPGVTILIKGTNTGALTDLDGKYSINVPKTATALQFSFVGMTKQEVALTASDILDVVLQSEAQNIEGVVVTALGITREKKSLGYAISEVTGDEIARGGNPSMNTALSGKVAGVEVKPSSGMPGAPAQILIRGSRSFSGDNTPLYVVDGMPIQSTSDYGSNVTGAASADRAIDIDPNDIATMTVLKGQAAAALYGIRASNGVIIITTKSGKGMAKGKPVVTFSTTFNTDVVARLPEVQQTYAQGVYTSATTRAFRASNSFSWGPAISDLHLDPVYGGDANGQPGKFWDPYKAGWVTPQAYNNAKNFFSNNGSTFGNNISISQANELGDFLLGFGSTNQSGIIAKTGMNRYNAKLAANANLGKNWKSGFSANYSDISIDKVPSGNDSWLFTVYGAPASFDLMGTPYHQPGINGDYRQISYRGGTVGENPRWGVQNNKFTETTKRIFGNAYIEYKPVDWFKLRYQLGLDSYNTISQDYHEMGSSYGQALPTAAQYTKPTKPDYTYVAPSGGAMDNYGISRKLVNSLLNLSFNKKITQDITALLDLGNDFTENDVTSYWMSGTGFTIPAWNNMSNTSTQTAGGSISKSRTVGFYGNFSLDYKSMLYLNATGREDIVSTMPNGSRSFFYPSVSTGFIFTQLEPLKNNKIFSFGKIRASYAEVGQAGQYFPVSYVLGGAGSGFLSDGITFPLGGVSGYEPSSTLYDPMLKPQNTSTWEAGIELRFFDSRFGFDYAYSSQVATDQIFPVPMAGSTGYAQVYMNAGKMTVKGHELNLFIIPVKTTNFEWTFNTLFTKYKNECVSLAPGVESISLGGYTTPNIRASAGETYPAIYGNQFLRDDKGHILVDEDPESWSYGMPLMGDFGKIGEVSPNFLMVFNNTFTYKFLSLSAQIDWKDGGQMYSGSNRLMDLYGSSKATEDRVTPYIYPGYKANGTPNDIQRGGPDDIWAYQDLYANVLSSLDEAHIYSTSFVKLRQVTLSIALPKAIISKAKLQAVSLELSARNFLLWTPLPNFDPEASQGQGNMQGGMDYMSLPQARSYGVGLNITF
ncbi:MAG: SusC/RagA family TonB-linked outer membrane protein [Lentimicrobiaceae bacterium]|jgi:TonB-linked SusC/RagA family outer membrane protein